MRTAIALAILFSPALLANQANPDAVKSDLKKLAGTWEGYAVDGMGEQADRGPVHLRLTIMENKISAVDLGNGGKDMGSGTFQIDPGKALKEIDATGIVLPGKRERTYLGIYAVDNDTLKWCVDNRQKGRPTAFRTAAGNYLLVLKRQK